jgi:CHAT domain-containing protein
LDEEAVQEFFEPFLAPLASPSKHGDRMTAPGDIVWLVPHDALHYVPLHALRVQDQYVGERNPVCYTPSASVMRYCRESRDRRAAKGHDALNTRALILADSRTHEPLLHARDQARAIQELLGRNAEVFTGGAATKDLVKERFAEGAPPIDILHVACHGYFSAVQPLRSGIALAPQVDRIPSEPREDDPANLTAEEIFSLRLDTELVTLSACETGVNERRPGDELIGLTRAVLYAGTPSVVVTLWSVDAISTSLLMEDFYRALIEGAGKAAALQRAQLRLRRVTAAEVISHCERARERLGVAEGSAESFVLDWDIADMQFAGCDFEAALSGYERLLEAPGLSDSWVEPLDRSARRCRLALRAPKPPDPSVRPFDHPYYWAPFILGGDWR